MYFSQVVEMGVWGLHGNAGTSLVGGKVNASTVSS